MSTQQNEETGYHGYRYLVDANNDRQYSVRFENGKPVRPIGVFAVSEKEGAFKPDETIFAFDDETETSMNGALRLSTTLFQIKTGGTGSPRSLKMATVEFDVCFEAIGKTVELTYKMTPDSEARLTNLGFDATFPKRFAETLDPADRGILRQGNVLQLDSTLIKGLSFPPHQAGGALIARVNVEAAQEQSSMPKKTATAAKYRKVDDQTLEETKILGDGERMKVVFNFEARRVTEVFEGPGGKAAIGYSFADCGSEALETAYERLSKLDGKPKPLDEKKAPGIKRAM